LHELSNVDDRNEPRGLVLRSSSRNIATREKQMAKWERLTTAGRVFAAASLDLPTVGEPAGRWLEACEEP
jgi:hypothetical protein